ncbi:hypothetical protein DAMA08_037190 [Martiniozyma asiatica (nom. inval.)]|nr:hypothetical protein DAMA08_037190 [Martiniozyma asiatica]
MAPQSPPHPKADTEFTIPSGPIPDDLRKGLVFDENDSDNDDISMEDVSVPLPKVIIKEEDEDVDSVGFEKDDNPLTSYVPKDSNYITPLADFSDITLPPIDPLNPFGANNGLSSSSPIPIEISNKILPILSDLQEQRLLNYIDNKIMELQRGFVQYLAQNDKDKKQLNDILNSHALSWHNIAHKIDELLEFIWFSITSIKGVPGVYHWNVYLYLDTPDTPRTPHDIQHFLLNETKIIKQPSSIIMAIHASDSTQLDGKTRLILPKLKSSGCISYLISIMGELITMLVKYPLNDYTDWLIAFRLLGKLDDSFCILLDYGLITMTERVRVASIVQRTKVALVQLFERFTSQIMRQYDEEYVAGMAKERQKIEIFQIYVGEIYEGLIDRTSI